jgi:ferrochelatase
VVMREAILLMSYGTPERIEDIEPYYTHIRRGDPPPPELLEELIERYRSVGGPTALNRITRLQGEALHEELHSRGFKAPVYVGFKHTDPFIGETVDDMTADGVERIVGLVLAPHYSLRSIAEYTEYAEKARPSSVELEVIPTWHDHPGFIRFLADRLQETVAGVADSSFVLFTAHSVPARVLERGDPYPDELHRTCELVADAVGVEKWAFAYQSAGRTADEWLGPDILDVIAEAGEKGQERITVQAIGFVADHLEVLYDIDIEAKQAAEEAGMTFARTAMPNDHPDFIHALADIVAARLAGPGR